VDVGESPSESVKREVKEESGYEVRAVRLLALWERKKHPHSAHSLPRLQALPSGVG
jgi:ADP-ribose pyrophosphatase YjhB (NUDIX family)